MSWCRQVIPAALQIIKTGAIRNQLYKHQPYIAPSFNAHKPRQFSTEVKHEVVAVDYEYTKKATSNPNVLIVDVREPDEIKEHGKIPNSVNIPLGIVPTALGAMSDKDFKELYNIPKPTEDAEIIFYCMIGKRSGKAQQSAIDLGYKNTKNYLGSWTDWANRSQK